MKKGLTGLCLGLIILALSGCGPGLLDWSHDLPNGFRLARSKPYAIGIVASGSKGSQFYTDDMKILGIPREVVAYKENIDITCFIVMDVEDAEVYRETVDIYISGYPSADGYWDDYAEQMDIDIRYYVLDKNRTTIEGPYSDEKSCMQALIVSEVSSLGPWVPSTSNGRIAPMVVQFCYNDRYVGASRIHPDEISYDAYVNGKEVDVDWFLIDTLEDTVYGPFENEEEYTSFACELGVTDLNDWVSVTQKPEGVKP